jgi:hypothetical protein
MAAACEKVTFSSDDQRFDLCNSCKEIVLEVLTQKKAPEPPDVTEKPTSENRRKKGNRRQ